MGQEKFTFQAEVSKLLDIVAHSLYSHKEIFLRELISNSSDACEKRSFLALTQPELTPEGGAKIMLAVDAKKGTLAVADNGIGMNHDDLVEMLGTIARSGTQAFLDQIAAQAKKKDKKKDKAYISPIGQFGVGFYSAFMVAKKVEVLTRKAGEDKAWLWVSDGKGEFSITDAERGEAGTTVTLHITKEDKEFLERSRIEHIIRTHSDHIAIPIVMAGDGEAGEEKLNTASALWTRPKKDINADQYTEFYHHVGHGFDEPWMILHNTVEGMASYTSLLFIPSMPPMDLFHPERKGHVKLYARRVFITDDCEGLLPGWLRFLRGVVDSQDLSLNISREMLQNDPKLVKIRKGLVKKVLGELKKKASSAPNDYALFWNNFGTVLKEGLYEDFENRDKLLELARFRSTKSETLTSLAGYVERMGEGQDSIYYIFGEDKDQIAHSPQLEGFRARGIEVLLCTDPIDEFWVSSVGTFQDKPFASVTKGDAGLDKIAEKEKAKKGKGKKKKDKVPDLEPLIAAMKTALDGEIKDVMVSTRLTDSPVCLVAGEGDMDLQLERMLKQHGQLKEGVDSLRILEINADHSLIRILAERAGKGEGDMTDAAHLLLDQARIAEGETVRDPAAFSARLCAVLEKGLD